MSNKNDGVISKRGYQPKNTGKIDGNFGYQPAKGNKVKNEGYQPSSNNHSHGNPPSGTKGEDA